MEPEGGCALPEESAACGLGGKVLGAEPGFPLDEVGAFATGPEDLAAVEAFGVTTSTGLGGGEGLITGLGAGGFGGTMTAYGTPGSISNPTATSCTRTGNR